MDQSVDTVRAEDGCGLWASQSGDGEPVVLCHGGPGLWDMFAAAASVLARRMRVIRWDQRGCGRSERRGPYSVDRSVADLDAVRRHFGFDRIAVLGHSWGAQLALRYALDHPDRVSRLVYVSGTGLGRDWHPHYKRNLAARLAAVRERMAELEGRRRTWAQDRELVVLQWTADFADPATALEHAEQMATPWFEVNYECNSAIGADQRTWHEADLVAACERLAVPTLIVHGEQDIRPGWAVDSLARALPSATRMSMRHVGHVPWLEAPEDFYPALLGHLCPTS
jgi:proline iminopeptidase